MPPVTLTRRVALAGALTTLGGCSAISALNSAAVPLDTYDLRPAPGSQAGRRTARTLLVAVPDAPAAIATDRIMVRAGAASVAYLPDARWTDELPQVVRSLLIRSISGTGRIAYVGSSDGGPVPDSALLVRIDAFNLDVRPDAAVTVLVDLTLTLLDDGDQRVIASQGFRQTGAVASDAPEAVVAGFQAVLDGLLPAMADWAVARA